MFMRRIINSIVINTNALVSYYNFDDNILDSVGTNDCTHTDLTYSVGKSGKCGVFNGIARVIATNDISLQLTTGSISGFVKCTNAGSGYRGIIIKQYAYGLFANNGVIIAYGWGSSEGVSAGNKSTTFSINDGLWHHVVQTFEMGVVGGTKVYIDGILQLTTEISPSSNIRSLTIGAGSSDVNVQQISGEIDCVSVWNKVLTQVEITELYNIHNAGMELI